MNEAHMQVLFRDYIKQRPPVGTEAYELKISKTRLLPFEKVKEHQISALLECESGFFYKITDPPIFYGGKMRFNVPRPFDCLYLKGVKGYLVFWFYKPRVPKRFIKVRIQDFIKFRDNSKSKSFSEEDIMKIEPEVLNVTIK